MAEANLQASNTEISSDILSRTLAQVQPELQRTQEASTGETSTGVSTNFGNSDILRTLNSMVARFDSFEQQARVDREKVSKLCEQFNSDHSGTRKVKMPKKTLNKNVCATNTDFSSFRGARPRTQMPSQPLEDAEDLLTYEQFLLLHQARSSSDSDSAVRAGHPRPSNRVISDTESVVFRGSEEIRQQRSLEASW